MGFLPSTVKLTKGGRGSSPGRRAGGRNPIFIAVCTVRQRQVNAARRAAPCPVQTDDVAYQRSQGQAPALSYEREALGNAICSLDTTLLYKKNKKKEKKQGLANHSHSLWGSSVLRTNCVMQNPIPMYLHPTPTHVNHEHQGR